MAVCAKEFPSSQLRSNRTEVVESVAAHSSATLQDLVFGFNALALAFVEEASFWIAKHSVVYFFHA